METKCTKCGMVHYPIALYKKWIKKYEGQAHFPKAKEQVARWQQMVDDHDEIVRHNKTSEERNNLVPKKYRA